MEKAKIAGKQPMAVELIEGKTYAWCTCGESSKQPFCDGKHKDSGFKPSVFKAEKSETKYFSNCKQTGNAPYCDGTHAKL
ncbi:MAG: CDGSH iron-sulfur domain-containing protein [Bacteroidetes bacterium]|nr:MAG: CDGSH iron-sulfur domain-containing protein [Bacteroidota bacterium]